MEVGSSEGGCPTCSCSWHGLHLSRVMSAQVWGWSRAAWMGSWEGRDGSRLSLGESSRSGRVLWLGGLPVLLAVMAS